MPKIPIVETAQYVVNQASCGAGCSGEIYWGEWISDPPKCDPCDNHGNYVGHQPGLACRPGILGIRTGQVLCPTACGHCDTCTSGVVSASHVEMMPTEATYYEGEVMESSSMTTYPTSTRSTHNLGRGSR